MNKLNISKNFTNIFIIKKVNPVYVFKKNKEQIFFSLYGKLK